MLPKFKTLYAIPVVLMMLVVFAGCHNYYKVSNRNVSNHPDKSLDSLQKLNRYFVLRTPRQAYYMSNTILSTDRKTITATLDTLPPQHKGHLNKGKGKMRYNNLTAAVLSEVHFYISEVRPVQIGSYTLSLDEIQKIEVIEKDKKRTANSYVIGTLGYTLGAITLAGIIAVATKSSCPFVSAYDGEQFALQGEIYGGAIYPQLVRHDYLPLKMHPAVNGNLQLKISNELQEKQFTDMADLIVVKHDKSVRVLSDANGTFYNISHPEPPVSARLSDKDVTDALLFADKRMLYFDDSSAGNNSVVLQFDRKQNIKKGKLVLSLKNSYWLDYLYGELAKGFGKYYNTYTAQQRKTPPAKLHQWTKDQQVPLSVSIKTNEGWKNIADVTTIGPLALRDIVIPVDLTGADNSKVEIKLSTGYLFWELDYAAIDFSDDRKMAIETLKPSAATDETGKDVLNLLTNEDNQYLEQPVPGTVATLDYKFQPTNNSNEAYTFILHTRGYYEHVRNFKGSADRKFLEQFKKPGAFPQYSLQRFKQFNKEQMEALSKR